MRKTRKNKTHKSRALRICIFAFVIYAAVMLVDMQVTISSRRQELTDLRARLETQRLVNKDLARRLAQGVDDQYIERIAREKLDYVAPDERVYIDISGS